MSDIDIKARYEALHSQRTTHLNRARNCAKLTIPHLLPEEGHDHNREIPYPNQGFGARAVNNLSSKLWMTVLPPGSTFFKLSLSAEMEQEIRQTAMEEVSEADIMSGLANIESMIMDHIENKGIRTPLFAGIRQYVTTGNVCVYVPDKSNKDPHHPWHKKGYGAKVFRLDQYVVVRDATGNLVELIINEKISFAALPEDVKRTLAAQVGKEYDSDTEVDLYTRILRSTTDKKKFNVTQAVEDYTLQDRNAEYDHDKLPWLVLRWSQDGDYGRGPVEEYLGDLAALDNLTKAMVEGSLGSAKVVFLCDPNGVTRPVDLSKAKNMDFKYGREEDVTVLRVEKANDFSTALQMIQAIEQRLSEAFLMRQSVQRQAERVTAEEIRYMAQELEDVLGGVYSMMSQDLQTPLVRLVLNRLEGDAFPRLPEGTIQPVITTGLEALGRNHEQQKLRAFLMDVTETFGPEVAARWVNAGEYIKRAAINIGIDTDGLIKSEQQVQQEIEQERQAQMAQQATGPVAGEMAKGMVNQQQEGGGQPI